MKHLIKTSLWLLAFMIAGGMLVSCVEEEQEPDFDETGGSASAKIDVKMPAPSYYGSFYAGSEVLLKGSGFSGRDEVYVQRATYRYNEDTDQEEYVADGPKVRAEVTDYTSVELTFLVPGEVAQSYGTALVLFKRGGKEYQLGRMEISPFPVHLEASRPLIGGSLVYLISTSDFAFGNNDKVFLQNYVEHNGNRQGVGEKIQAKVESINSSKLCFVIPQQITGEVLVILEHNGIASALDDYFVVDSFMPYISLDPYAIISQNANLLFRGAGSSFFTDTDKVYLRSVRGGSKVKVTITYRDGSTLSFRVPDLFNGGSGEVFVILEHYGVEYQLDNILPIYRNY